MKTIFRCEVGKKNEENKRKSRKNEENWKKRKKHQQKAISTPAKFNAQNPANINARWQLMDFVLLMLDNTIHPAIFQIE